MDPNGCLRLVNPALPAQPENEADPAKACEKKRTNHECTLVVAESLIDMSRYRTWLNADYNVPRTKWPLAKIEKVYPGNDGLVRTATVRAQSSFYNRPVQRLHKLEIELATPQVSPETGDQVHGGEKPQTNTVHATSIPVSKPKLSVVHPEGGQRWGEFYNPYSF